MAKVKGSHLLFGIFILVALVVLAVGPGLESTSNSKLEIAKITASDAILGKDENRNGIRDDVEIEIGKMPGLRPEGKAILHLGAQAYQEAMSATLTKSDRDNKGASASLAKFLYCLTRYAPMERRAALTRLKNLQFNTPKRKQAYNIYNQSRNGTVQKAYEASEAECLFNAVD